MRTALLFSFLVAWLIPGVVAQGNERAADLIRAGNTAYRAGQYADAAGRYEQALALGPNRAVSLNLGHARLRQQQWDRAIAAYARAEPVDAWSWIAECHLERGRIAEAERALTMHLTLSPGDAEAEARRAHLLVRLGRHETALIAYRAKAEANPADPSWLRLIAQELTALGRAEEAMTALEIAWRLGDRSRDLARTLGDLYLAREMYAEAAAFYEVHLSDNANASAEDWFRLGYTYFQAKSYVAAKTFFDRAADLDPKHANCQLFLGNVDLGRGNLKAAEARFRAALARDASLADAHVALGNLAYGGGDLAAAIGHYDRAIALGNRTLAVHYNRILALQRAKRTDDAVAALKKALHAHPENPRLLGLLKRLR